MAKKTTPIDMQIKQFEKRLDESDELTKKLLLAIHGDESLNVEGLIPVVQRFAKQLAHLITRVDEQERWKNLSEENRGMIQIKRSVLIQRILAGAGLVGILVSAAIGVTQIIDWLGKQGILEQLGQ